MNKYEEALKDILDSEEQTYSGDSVYLMQELVKRATPMKPHVYTLFITDGSRNHMWNREISENRCGSCDKKIDRDFAFCPYCGQAIKWSDEK